MKIQILKNYGWVVQTLLFFKNHLLVILALGSIAAFGRAAQLGAFGPLTSVVHGVLEVAIQSARVAIFIYTLGLTNLKSGFSRLKNIFTNKNTRKANWRIASQRLKNDWPSLLASFVIYALIAFIINTLIDYATYQTCLYYKLKTNEIISAKSSEWVIILFFKNLSVIPLTLVFNALFFLWITNKENQITTS